MNRNKSRVSRLPDHTAIGGILASLTLLDDSNLSKVSNDKHTDRFQKERVVSKLERNHNEFEIHQSPDHKSSSSHDESRPLMYHIGGKENIHSMNSPLVSPILRPFDSNLFTRTEIAFDRELDHDFEPSLSHSSSSCLTGKSDDSDESESDDSPEEDDLTSNANEDSQDTEEENDDDEDYDDQETESEHSNSLDSEGNPYIVEEEYVPYGRHLSKTLEGEDDSKDKDSCASISDYQQNSSIQHSPSDSDTETETGSGNISSSGETAVGLDGEDNVDASLKMNSVSNKIQYEEDNAGSEDYVYFSDDDHVDEERLVKKELKSFDQSFPSSLCFASNSRTNGSVLKRGKWTLGSRIAQGTFGVVHVGMNTLTGKLMAVKTMNISSRNRQQHEDLRREIEFMKSFEHRNIVKYLGCEIDRGKQVLHIFQEWVPGGSVASLLRKFGPFPLSVIRSYLYQILIGLSYLHSKNILHRDIKGGNVLVNDDGVVKLADFGASKCMESSEEDRMENMTMCGTPYFMAPEVFKESYGTKADVWACACVAYQMCTTNPPWKGFGIKSPIRLYDYIMENEGPPPLTIPMPTEESEYKDQILEPTMNSTLADLMERCFIRDSKKRPSVANLLEHAFFKETETLDGSILADESILESVGALSPISPLKIQDIKMSEKKKKNDKDSVWPNWAK